MRKFLPLALLTGPLGADAEPAFSPELVPGTTLRPRGLGVELRVPSRWTPMPSQLNGMGVLLFQVPDASGRALVFGNVLPLPPSLARLPPAALLARAVPLLAGHVATRPLVGPETFTVGGRPAGRVVVATTIAAPQGPRRAEIYIGTVLFGAWAHAISGIYEADLAETIRPGLDTLLATLRGEAPPRNTDLERRVVGGWERASSYLHLDEDGSYTRQSAGRVSGGTFRIVGNVGFFTAQNGQTSTSAVAADRGFLVLDGARWTRCG